MAVAIFAIFLISICMVFANAEESSTEAPSQITDCICPLVYRPFCASDLETYANLCDLTCAMARQPGLHALCPGPCPCYNLDNNGHETNQIFNSFQLQAEAEEQHLKKNPKGKNLPEACTCPRIIAHVCGSNGITYKNECLLDCDKHIDQNLEKVSNGKCKP